MFRDIDHIESGEDFFEVIKHKISACDSANILTGKNGLSAAEAEGRHRLDDAEDLVRLEVAAVLERKERVAPMLVGSAAMSRTLQWPEAIAMLGGRNALEVSET